ncbi:Coatomer subunit zeta-1 [Quaeritorhiza haematococci]|nr:Coatomer subunit zeta-1 [Quaeritorhiza haematococci]
MGRPNALNLNLLTTKAVILLDSEGKRLLSKYYTQDYPTIKEQKAFEKALFDKTKRMATGEIIMFDGHVVVYKNTIDVFIYFVGSSEENELILSSVLQAYYDSLSILLSQVEKRTMLENLDLVVLALDETIDDGIILESDPTQIASRVTKKGTEEGMSASGIPLSEQTIAQALQTAKEQLAKSLLK